ncbi:hypothetical protein EZS27_027806, partial [termite gut metagenome]
MFVRKKNNRSGSTSVVVVDKSGRRFRELKTIGVSSNAKELDSRPIQYERAGMEWNSDIYCPMYSSPSAI